MRRLPFLSALEFTLLVIWALLAVIAGTHGWGWGWTMAFAWFAGERWAMLPRWRP